MSDPMPAMAYKRAPCPRCGAVTTDEAETLCRPSSDQSGEYWCPADDMSDVDGFLLQPTPESIAELDAWYERQPR